VAQRGGYRKPNNPAPVSGPGSLSQRTDGGPTQPATYISGLPYGQGQETYSNQVAAPMAGNPIPQMEMPTPLMAPTARPNEPITTGVDIGDGAGSEAKPRLPNPSYTIQEVIRNLIPYDPSGDAELIYRSLIDEGY
jgi:hypothetical protein